MASAASLAARALLVSPSVLSGLPLHAQLISVGGIHAALWSGADHAAVKYLRKHICVWARADRREKGETILIIYYPNIQKFDTFYLLSKDTI